MEYVLGKIKLATHLSKWESKVAGDIIPLYVTWGHIHLSMFPGYSCLGLLESSMIQGVLNILQE